MSMLQRVQAADVAENPFNISVAQFLQIFKIEINHQKLLQQSRTLLFQPADKLPRTAVESQDHDGIIIFFFIIATFLRSRRKSSFLQKIIENQIGCMIPLDEIGRQNRRQAMA